MFFGRQSFAQLPHEKLTRVTCGVGATFNDARDMQSLGLESCRARQAVSRATSNVRGDFGCRARQAVSGATLDVGGDFGCRTRQSSVGGNVRFPARRAMSGSTFGTVPDTQSRQRHCTSPSRTFPSTQEAHTAVMVNTVLENTYSLREEEGWKGGHSLLLTIGTMAQDSTPPLRQGRI